MKGAGTIFPRKSKLYPCAIVFQSKSDLQWVIKLWNDYKLHTRKSEAKSSMIYRLLIDSFILLVF